MHERLSWSRQSLVKKTPAPDRGAGRRPHFIIRTIATNPWSSFLDGLAFLGFFRVDTEKLKSRYAFIDNRIQKEFEDIGKEFPETYRVSLPNISRLERASMADFKSKKGYIRTNKMDDYWIFFHKLSKCIVKSVPEKSNRFFILTTVYHALIHGMYNAVIHGDPDADIELRIDVSATAVMLEMENKAGPGNDKPRQYYTGVGIHVGGGGNTGDTLAQLFDQAELRVEEQGKRDETSRVKLVLRHDLKPRSWFVNLKRAFLARAIGTRDRRQLHLMSKAYM